MTKVNELNEIVAPAVEAVGFEFVGIEYKSAGKHSMLRIYIDSEQGINVDDCAAVSQQVSAVLDVEDPINNEYCLEVSSPGADRPLFTLAHYEQFVGKDVSLKLKVPQQGRRKFKGKIISVDEEVIKFEVEGDTFCFEVYQIEQANLVVKW